MFIPNVDVESGKTYSAGFCASLALLVGSCNNASCNGWQWLERAADCKNVPRLIYLYLVKYDFLSAFQC